MSPYGHMTRKACEGRGLQLLQALDDTIHYRTGYYDEALRKYARSGRDPLASTILDACRRHGLLLIVAKHTNGIYHDRHNLTSDEDVRRMCMRLRARLIEAYPADHARILYDLDLSEAKLASWTRGDYSSPRWSEFIRLAMHLHYRAWFLDPKTGVRYH